MGTTYYLVDHANKRAFDCGLSENIGATCSHGPVTLERLVAAKRWGGSPVVVHLASSWLHERSGAEVLLLADTADLPWTGQDWRKPGGWVVDDPWSYHPTADLPAAHVAYRGERAA